MKKLFTLIIVAVAMMIATPANAQVKFGLKGGFNVSNMSLSHEVLETSNRMGFFVGPTVKVTLPLTGLSFDLSALYNQSVSNLAVEKGVKEKTVSNKYVDIPLNARYGIALLHSTYYYPNEHKLYYQTILYSNDLPVLLNSKNQHL